MESKAVVAWMRLARVYQKITQAATAQLREFGLSLAQLDVLAQVGAAEGLTQKELAARLLVTKGNVSQLLDRLERVGLAVRAPEGRICRIYLTPDGRALYDRVMPAHETFINRELSALPAGERTTLAQLLRALDRSLE